MNFLTPNSLTEALEFATKHPDYKILAGGTDICVLMNSGLIKPKGVINIWGLSELGGITENGGSIEIGSLATHTQIAGDSLVKKYLPALALACSTIGARQIQNRGTIGGNVMNASPAGDTLPPLVAHDAEVEAASPDGRRWIRFSDFYTGYRKTALKAGELITKFKLPKAPRGEKSAFLKVGTRRAQAISKVMACFRYYSSSKSDAGGRVEKQTHVIIAFGSIAPTPVRLYEVEKFLTGKELTAEVINEAVKLTKKAVQPIDDIRSTADYRRHVCGVLVRRFLSSVSGDTHF